MSLSFAHLMEFVPRVYYFDAQLWIASTTRGLYYMFGTLGVVFEVGAIIAAFVLVYLVRGRGKSFRLTVGAAVLAAIALALWFMYVAPVNAELATWTPDAYPVDWTRFRNLWEYTHAVNAVIKIVAFSLLLLSLIVETPGGSAADARSRRAVPGPGGLPASA